MDDARLRLRELSAGSGELLIDLGGVDDRQKVSFLDLGSDVEKPLPHVAARTGVKDGLLKRLEDRKIRVELSEKAKDLVIAEAYDPIYGARPLKRTIQRRILDPLAVRVLQGDFREGDTVLIDDQAGELGFNKAEAAVPA